MNEGLKNLKEIVSRQNNGNGDLYLEATIIKPIEKELKKPQELYNLIKQKCANAQINYNYHYFKDKEFKGQIAAYNDVLSLIESMFEVSEDD